MKLNGRTQGRATAAYAGRHQILTMSTGEIHAASRELLRLAVEAMGSEPAAIIAVPTAGTEVAHGMRSREQNHPPIIRIRANRPTRKLKASPIVRRVLQITPLPLLNMIRKMELRTLTAHSGPGRTVQVEDPKDYDALCKGEDPEPNWVLLVDDCVDTGGSLSAVRDRLASDLNSTTKIVSVAIAQSLPNPSITPDFVLHQNCTIRGPWSNDYPH